MAEIVIACRAQLLTGIDAVYPRITPSAFLTDAVGAGRVRPTVGGESLFLKLLPRAALTPARDPEPQADPNAHAHERSRHQDDEQTDE